MPKYDFQCQECEHQFEALSLPGKTHEVKCLRCGSQKTRKLLSAPAIILKGQGFYKTDSLKSSSASKPTCGGASCSACSSCS